MSTLITDLNIALPDNLYAKLIAMYDGVTEAEGRTINAKLILLLANHIGDERILDQAIAIATKQKPEAETRS